MSTRPDKPSQGAPVRPRSVPAESQPNLGRALPLPHERDESAGPEATQHPEQLDAMVVQAKKDLDAGLIDTDSRNPPGADAEQRARLLHGEVPGPGSNAESRAGEAHPPRKSRPER